MAKNVQLTVDIKGGDSVGKAAEKTKTLKQELRELKNELASGSLTGKAFDEATARAGKLSDTIIDVNNRVKALATDGPDVVLKGFGDMATGIVGGFAAAQGAMALFGSENEDLQKTLVKLQGATALLNGLQQVNATLQSDSAAMVALNTAKTKILTFVQLRYAAAVGTSTGAMKALRIVGMTLGIGVIVAAVGLLIANFDKVKAVVMGVVDRFKGLSGTTKNILSVMFPFIGVIRLVYAGLEKLGAFAETAADRYEKLEKANQKQGKQMQREIDLMEAQGASARELYLAKHKMLMLEYETMEAKRKLIGLTTEEKEAQKDLANSIKVLNAQETKRQIDDADKKQKVDDEASKKAAEKRKAAHDKKVEQDKKNAEELQKILDEATIIKNEKDLTEQEKEIAALGRTYKAKLDLAKNDDKAQKLIIDASLIELQAIKDKYAKEEAEKKKEADKVLADLIEQRRVDDLSVRDKELNDIIDKYAKEAELAKGHADLLAEIETDKNNALALKKKEFAQQDADFQKEVDNVRLDSMIATANQASQLLSAVAGKNKSVAMAALAVEKGAAIADVIIKGIRERSGITAKYSLIPGGQALAVPELIASRIRTGLSVATIAATGIQGAKSIGNSGGSGGGSVQPPNIRGSQTTNEPTSQPATKVFVTETDIRSSLRKVDGIYSQSTIQ
jgi:hypothetical protein